IAAGIFVLSGLAVSNVGAGAILAFLIAAVVASFTAAAYAEFAAIYPESGGGYMYVANTYDTDATYLVGWAMILGYPASAAFYLASFSDWFYQFMVPALRIPEAIPYWFSGVAVLLLLVAVNVKGTKETGAFQIVVTIMKVALILIFLYGGLRGLDMQVVADSFAANVGDLREIGLTSALVFITFFGFEAIATNAEEIEAPGRTVPRAIFLSMGFVTLVYVAVVLVVVLAVNDLRFLNFLAEQADLAGPDQARTFVAENGELSMGRAAQYYLGDFGFYVIIVGALFSMLSAANATIMAGSRVKLAMARRKHLPSAVERVHRAYRTPHVAVLMTGTFIALMMLTFSVVFGGRPGEIHPEPLFGLHLGIEGLAHFADFLLLTGLIFVNLAIIRSRAKAPELKRPFRVPFVPWVPVIAVVANLVLLVNVELKSLLLGVGAQVVGILFWFFWKARPRPVEELEAAAPTVIAEYRAPGHEKRILVPVVNPDRIDRLLRTAAALAREVDGELLLMSAVVIPDQTPLSEGRRYGDKRRDVLRLALESAEDLGVPVSGIVRITHDAAEAILNTIEQHDVDAALLGWTGRSPSRSDLVFGSTVDRVMRDARCDVLVERVGVERKEPLRSILVPTAGGPHARLAGEVAVSLAGPEGGAITLVSVARPGSDEEELRSLLESERQRLMARREGIEIDSKILRSEDVSAAIVDESGHHDTTVIGATREGLLQRLLVGAIPRAVAQEASSTVIMVKRYQGVTSLVRKVFRWR
ncbi:MAG: amino acid permease, partial [Longimicrobiales bacterium]|nr:amino acid permease [Longimicrobiales bacterium]